MNGHAVCPFCELPVTKAGTEFGDSILHEGCYATLQEEMDGGDVVSLSDSPTFLEQKENDSEAA